MAANKQELVSTFLEITMCNCRLSALKILEDVEWNIEAAIQMFFEGKSSHGESTVPPSNPYFYLDSTIVPTGWGSDDEDDAEVDDDQKHFDLDATIQPRLESNSGTAENSNWNEEEFNETNLSLLHGCPNYLIFQGHFHEAKVESSHLDRWLLVNVQTSEQFNSRLLNRETWSNVSVQELLKSHFLFWQINHKDSEGQKVCYFYKLMAFPAILVVDPITGEKMYACQGMKQPEDLLEDLMRFSDTSPKQHLLASTRSENPSASTDQTVANEASQHKETNLEPTIKTSYPPLPEEPTEKKHICKVGICFPSGERVQRSFLKTDSTKLLWSFCSTFLKKEEEFQSFCFIVPCSPMIFYDMDASFEEAGLSNTLLRLSFRGDSR